MIICMPFKLSDLISQEKNLHQTMVALLGSQSLFQCCKLYTMMIQKCKQLGS